MRRRTTALGLIGVLVLAVLGYGALDAYDKVPGVLTRAQPTRSAAPVRPHPVRTVLAPGPVLRAPAVSTARTQVTMLSARAPVPTRAGIRAALRPIVTARKNPLGAKFAVVVRDAATGAHLYDLNSGMPLTPASITKLLSASAVASTLDPNGRLVTRAVAGRGGGQVVLVAGGDSLLAPGRGHPGEVLGRAGLADLAARVARSVRRLRHPSAKLHLVVDARYAAGPLYAPGWTAQEVALGYVGPVAPIGLSTQFPEPGHPASKDPAMSTLSAFRAALVARGLQVSPILARGTADPHAHVLGSVRSAPLGQVLARALQDSDNALTESLVRLAAVRTGNGTTFAGMTAFVRSSLSRLGIDTRGVHLADDCGLSDGTLIPARVQADILDRAAGGHDPRLAQVLSGLPVAGLTGTLHDRYRSGPAAYAAGRARAKTGTLPTVAALAGTVVDASGRLLTFVVVSNKLKPGYAVLRARATSDELVARLGHCGCR